MNLFEEIVKLAKVFRTMTNLNKIDPIRGLSKYLIDISRKTFML